MADLRPQIEERATEIVQDQAKFVIEQVGLLGRTVTAAIHEHSGNYAAESAPVMVSDGERIQSLPAGYVDRFSRVTAVEYPLAEDDGDPRGMDKRLWLEVRKGGVKKLMFIKSTPANGEEYAVHFTYPHAQDGSTLAAHEVEAVAYLCAAHVAESMAARTAQGLEMSIPAESVDLGDKPAVWKELSKGWRGTYKAIMTRGMMDDTSPATPDSSFGTVTWDSPRRYSDRRLFGRTDA